MPSAHEVEQFVYCAHNWELARRGVDPHEAPQQRGEAQDRLLRLVQLAARQEREAKQATWVSAIIVGLAAVAALGVFWAIRSDDPRLPFVLVAACLLLLNLGIAALLLGQHYQESSKRKRMENSLGPLGLEAVAEEVRDPMWNVSGRIQFALQSSGSTVPVLVKSGAAPRTPYASHRLHLGVLLRLVEVRDGRRPNYGLIAYRDGLFAVAWDGLLEQELKEVLARMEAAMMAGKADRDHNELRRCRGCARRQACTQRLG